MIVCTLNRPEHLARLAESLLLQTRLPDEIVIVNGGSEVGLESVLSALGAAIGTVKCVTSQPGLTRQRNRGIDVCTGDIVQFFDDDVVLEPEYLQRIEGVFTADSPRRVWAAQGRITNLPGHKGTSRHAHFRDRIAKLMRGLFMLPDRGDGRIKVSCFHPLRIGVPSRNSSRCSRAAASPFTAMYSIQSHLMSRWVTTPPVRTWTFHGTSWPGACPPITVQMLGFSISAWVVTRIAPSSGRDKLRETERI